MRSLICALALLFAVPAVHAETNACTAIVSLPAVITAPGPYCLEKDLSLTAGVGHEKAIFINTTSDVVLDCNNFRISGSKPSLATFDTTDYTGIYVGSSSRVQIRNCKVIGFNYGIQVGRASNGAVRSRDVTIQENRITGSGEGIQAFPEGINHIQNNGIANSLIRALEVDAPPGQTFVSENLVIRSGDTVSSQGHAGSFGSDLGGWLVVTENVFSETVSPAGSPGAATIFLGPAGGIGVYFGGNKIIAPANSAEMGVVTNAVNNAIGTACQNNKFIGYGAELPANCTDPSNQAF